MPTSGLLVVCHTIKGKYGGSAIASKLIKKLIKRSYGLK